MLVDDENQLSDEDLLLNVCSIDNANQYNDVEYHEDQDDDDEYLADQDDGVNLHESLPSTTIFQINQLIERIN